MRNCLWLVALCCFAMACAKAPTNDNQEAPAINSVDVVKANPQEVSITAGESGEAVVQLKITNGYHVNANPPTFPYLIATELELTPAAGISVDFINYPNGLSKKFSFADQPLSVYEGETELKVRLSAKSAQPGTHNLSAKLRVQACDDQVCYAPGTMDLTLPVIVK